MKMEKRSEIKETVRERIKAAPPVSRAALEAELERCIGRITENLRTFTGGTMPGPSGENNIYPVYTNSDWTAGFWCGMLWLAYEYTGEGRFRNQALRQCKSFQKRYEERVMMDSHDVGFLYTLSCVAGYKITGEAWLRDVALGAADLLMTRYKEKGGFIQSWGDNGDRAYHMFIIDSLMNLSLLFWAGEVTGDPAYTRAAESHANACAAYALRPDGSTYHAFYFDPETGNPIGGETAQGYADDSAWARGQTWAMYGFSLAFEHVKNQRFLNCAREAIYYFLNHMREDFLCYWDLVFQEPSEELLDSSASAIEVCALLEYADCTEDTGEAELCRKAARCTLRSLAQVCSAQKAPASNGLLLHGVYSIPHGLGVDECCIWGDYFYMEALVRLCKEDKWERCW